MPARRKQAERKSSSSKRIVVYALIGIIAVAAVSVSMLARSQPTVKPPDENANDPAKLFQSRFCGTESRSLPTRYITEIQLPSECEMPLAIEAEENRIWYVSTKQGTLGSYNTAEGKFEKEYALPSWPTRASPTAFAMSWSAKADPSGNIWFTDERQKALWRFNVAKETFDIFYVPANLPSAIEFDSKGNVLFVGVQSTSIFVGDIDRMKNGTSEGITEFPLPLEGFAGVDNNLVTTGSLAVDPVNNDIWVPLLAFQQKGQLFRYDIDAEKITKTVDLPADLSSPVGLALDNSGNLWVTDHGTSIFFMYEPATDKIVKFVTSVASPRIYGGQTPPNAYTLPYWIYKDPRDGSLWFNEHTGNKIARFDPETLLLTEYWIPSQNRNWAACPSGSEPCGTANALQLSIGSGSQIWFSEWSENRIARLNAETAIPFSISVKNDEMTVSRGGAAEIELKVEGTSSFSGNMIAAGTFLRTGQLGESTGIFSEQSISVEEGTSKQVSFTFSPADSIAPGEYVIMVGAGNDEVSIMKAVKLNVV